ncbi:hypothetical protein KEM52_002385, partial [Ascosphaera acerosa]
AQAEQCLALYTEQSAGSKGKGPGEGASVSLARGGSEAPTAEGKTTRRGTRGGGGGRSSASGGGRQKQGTVHHLPSEEVPLSRAALRPTELNPVVVRHWRAKDVGLFHPETFSAKGMAARYHDGDTTIYRMVTAFTMRVRTYSHTQPGSSIRNHLESLLRGRALSWWTDVVPVQDQVDFATSEEGLEDFCLALERRFKPTPGEAKRALAAIRYTAADARKGRSVEEYVALIRSACKAKRWDVDNAYIAYTAWNQLQTRLRYFIPQPTEDVTIEEFIRTLRGHETNWKELPPEREDGTGTRVYYTRAELNAPEPAYDSTGAQVTRAEFDELRTLFADLLKLQREQMAAEVARRARIDAFYEKRAASNQVQPAPQVRQPPAANPAPRRPERPQGWQNGQPVRQVGRNQAYLTEAEVAEREVSEGELILLEEGEDTERNDGNAAAPREQTNTVAEE